MVLCRTRQPLKNLHRAEETDQDVDQLPVLWVATLGVEEVLHAEFCGIRTEAAAVPVQTRCPAESASTRVGRTDHPAPRRLWSPGCIVRTAPLTCSRKSKRASLPHSEWCTPTHAADLRSASLPQRSRSSFWYWAQLSGTEFWSLSSSATCRISGSHHTAGRGAPPMYRYGRISLRKVLSTAGRVRLRPSTRSRWNASTSNQSSGRLIREQRPRWQRSTATRSTCPCAGTLALLTTAPSARSSIFWTSSRLSQGGNRRSGPVRIALRSPSGKSWSLKRRHQPAPTSSLAAAFLLSSERLACGSLPTSTDFPEFFAACLSFPKAR
ncbi:hypothetical protein EYF80_029858 [Liparis tanakae]|uniref:Uncharacterized protein n=1 Tax=Liparis tanakae TaxID=230148 RepID=A0A4Z2H4R4_9TELE|nr:hypothetical protein EYF80_029858 [Liparis tanakae]